MTPVRCEVLPGGTKRLNMFAFVCYRFQQNAGEWRSVLYDELSLPSFVHHKLSDSRITLERLDLESPNLTGIFPSTGMFYNNAGYDITNYFRSEVIVKRTVENTASDGYGSNFSRMV